MAKPFFSCVMPVKGPRPYMEEALDSLKAQGMGDDLEIIVQDGDVEPDRGQSDALNKGFAKAQGEWLFWLNADDVLLKGALGKVRDYLCCAEHADRVEWIAGNTVYLDEKGIAKDVRTDAKWRPWFGRHLCVWTGGPSAFFRKSLWDRFGGFDADLKYVMDIDLWTRWAKAGVSFEGLDDYLWGFRMHEGSLTMGGEHEDEQRREREMIRTRHNLGSLWIWRNITRAAQLMDGSWWCRCQAAKQFRELNWRELPV